jgi:hypothetical protein
LYIIDTKCGVWYNTKEKKQRERKKRKREHAETKEAQSSVSLIHSLQQLLIY